MAAAAVEATPAVAAATAAVAEGTGDTDLLSRRFYERRVAGFGILKGSMTSIMEGTGSISHEHCTS